MLFLILCSILTLIIIGRYFFLIGLFFGIFWFPFKLIFIEEERQFFKEIKDNSINKAEQKSNTKLDKRTGTVLVFLVSFIFNFFSMLLFWPGIMLSNILYSIASPKD